MRGLLTEWGLCASSRLILHRDLVEPRTERAVLRAARRASIDEDFDHGPALRTLSERSVRFLAHVEARSVGPGLLVAGTTTSPAVVVQIEGAAIACTCITDTWGDGFLSLVAVAENTDDANLAASLRLPLLPSGARDDVWEGWTGLLFNGEAPARLEPYGGPLRGDYFDVGEAALAVGRHLPRRLACRLADT